MSKKSIELTRAVVVDVRHFGGRHCMVINPSHMEVYGNKITFTNYCGTYRLPFYGENAEERAEMTFNSVLNRYCEGLNIIIIRTPENAYMDISDDSDDWDADDSYHFRFTIEGKQYDAPGAVQVLPDMENGKIVWGLNMVMGGYSNIHWLDKTKDTALKAYNALVKAIGEHKEGIAL